MKGNSQFYKLGSCVLAVAFCVVSAHGGGVNNPGPSFDPTQPGPIGGTTPGTASFTTFTTSGNPTVHGLNVGTDGIASQGNVVSGGSLYANGATNPTVNYGGSLFLTRTAAATVAVGSTQGGADGTIRTNAIVATGSITTGATGSAVKNLRFATATLAAGSVTVADTAITATSQIYPSNYTNATGFVYLTSKTAGTGYTITSSNSSATNQISVEIVDF